MGRREQDMTPAIDWVKKPYFLCRTNSDKSQTYYLRWVERDESGQEQAFMERLFRTEENIGVRQKRHYRAEARRECNDRYKLLTMNDPTPRRRRLPFPLALEYYLSWAQAVKRSTDETLARQAKTVRGFYDYVAQEFPFCRFPSQLSNNMTARWCAHLQPPEGRLAPATVRTYITDLQAFLTYCEETGLLDPRQISLTTQRRLIKRAPKPQHPVPEDDAIRTALTADVDDTYRSAWVLLACTGLRIGEVNSLRLDDWDRDNHLIVVPCSEREALGGSTKRHHRILPVGEFLESVLATLSRVGPGLMNGGTPYGSKINHRLKPYRLTPHDFRRWFSQKLLDMECPRDTRDYLMGHSPGKVDEAYRGGVHIDTCRPWMNRVDALVEILFR